MSEPYEDILFYHNKFLANIKLFISIILCICCIIVTINISNLPIFLNYTMSTLFFISMFYGFYAAEDTIFDIFLKITPQKITYYYLILGKIESEINFYWKDIIEIREANLFFSKRIRIIYRDNFENKTRKHIIKIKNSKCSYDQIYDTLMNKFNEYNAQQNQQFKK